MADFTLPAGAHFANVFATAEGQLLVTLEPNDSGNASYVFRMWTADGFATGRVGINGGRAEKASDLMAANFTGMDAVGALAAFKLLMEGSDD